MRASKFIISTLKEAPAEAELTSHKLMLRAGMIKRLAAGIYTWMPLGLRVLRKVESVVRETSRARKSAATSSCRSIFITSRPSLETRCGHDSASCARASSS